MSREARVWLAICLVSGGFLLYRGAFSDAGLGRVYVKPAAARPTITSEAPRPAAAADEGPQAAKEAAAEGAQGNPPDAGAGAAANPGGPAAVPAPRVGEGQAWETARRGESGARVSIPRTVGLWLAAAWGGVLWLFAACGGTVILMFMPDFHFGGRFFIPINVALIAIYFVLTWNAAQERD